MEDWIKKYKDNLNIGGRGETMHSALQLLLKNDGHIIVETGCQRMVNDWGGGSSTTVFADFCKQFNIHLFSVDIDHDAVELSKELTQNWAVFVTMVENDSVEFLQNFNQKIDLLYLDSIDCPEYDGPESLNLIRSQVHQLREMEAAFDKLSERAVVLLDDNDFTNGGKAKLTKFFLKEHGFVKVLEGKQSLWQR